jgi:hypothetical protein
MKYLGLPLSTKRLKKQDYLPVLLKVQAQLVGWQNNQLSVAGFLFAKMAHQTSRENKKCFLLESQERAQPMPRRPLLGKIKENMLANKPHRIRDKRFKNTENIYHY